MPQQEEMSEFQFLTGTIKGKSYGAKGDGVTKFQFLTGTIKGSWRGFHRGVDSSISIPHRYD